MLYYTPGFVRLQAGLLGFECLRGLVMRVLSDSEFESAMSVQGRVMPPVAPVLVRYSMCWNDYANSRTLVATVEGWVLAECLVVNDPRILVWLPTRLMREFIKAQNNKGRSVVAVPL